jgi:hypothetical protein
MTASKTSASLDFICLNYSVYRLEVFKSKVILSPRRGSASLIIFNRQPQLFPLISHFNYVDFSTIMHNMIPSQTVST